MKVTGNKTKNMGEEGLALFMSMVFLVIFSIYAFMLMKSITTATKSIGYIKQETQRFYASENGIFVVDGYINNLNTSGEAPKEITKSDTFDVNIDYLSTQNNYLEGYDVNKIRATWIKLNSVAPNRINSSSEIEAIVFVKKDYGSQR